MRCGDFRDFGGPDVFALGLPSALAAAERWELTLGGYVEAFTWADREPDPANIAVLKRLADLNRCSGDWSDLLLTAIEAAGEPTDYFLGVAADWKYNDLLAGAAIEALGVRGDSAAYAPLREIVLAAPTRGRFGTEFETAFANFLRGFRLWDEFLGLPVSEQLDVAMLRSLDAARSGVIIRGVRGDSVSQLSAPLSGGNRAISRRLLRSLAQTYPTATAEALVAYQDTARTVLARRGIAARHVPLFLDIVERHGRETAFPSNAPPLPPVVASAQTRRARVRGDTAGPSVRP